MTDSVTERIRVGDDDLSVHVAVPSGPPRGGIVLIHEIWGLVPQIVDVAGRLAAEGFLVAAPDLLTSVGISPEVGQELLRLRLSADESERHRMQPLMREKTAPLSQPEYALWAVPALRAVVGLLEARLQGRGRLGVMGFCFGGSYAFALAAADDRIGAAVPFYGAPPDETDIGRISCPVLAFYGDQDTRLMETLPDVRRAMATAGVDFTAQVYPGVGHAFFNDANPTAYDAGVAADAWARTLALFERELVAG